MTAPETLTLVAVIALVTAWPLYELHRAVTGRETRWWAFWMARDKSANARKE